MPVTQTLTASRNATWAPTLEYCYSGGALPLTGAHIAMQVRLYGGAPFDALLTIGAIAFAERLVSGTPGKADEVRALTLSPVVDPSELAALPTSGEPGDATAFVFDIRISYADGATEILSSGTFIIQPGVTLV